MFRLALPLNPNYDSTILKAGGMMRKGANGDGEDLFTEKGMKTGLLLYFVVIQSTPVSPFSSQIVNFKTTRERIMAQN